MVYTNNAKSNLIQHAEKNMISDKYKCIFVHIPRTGGHAIMFPFGQWAVSHKSPDDYRKSLTNKWVDYYKFTFVRNPWDRLISEWAGQLNAILAAKTIPNSTARSKIAISSVYEDYLNKNVIPKISNTYRELHKLSKTEKVNWTFELSEMDFEAQKLEFNRFVKEDFTKYRAIGTKPQINWLFYTNQAPVKYDFVGRNEHFDDDLKTVLKNVGLSNAESVHKFGVTPRKRNYHDYYTDETKDLVAGVYKTDIEYLNYKFED